jgi:hypothetical protein
MNDCGTVYGKKESMFRAWNMLIPKFLEPVKFPRVHSVFMANGHSLNNH